MSWKDILKFDISFLDDVKAWVIKHKDKISDEDYELFQEYVFNHASKTNLTEFKRLAMKYPFYEDHMPFWAIEIRKSAAKIFLPAFKEGVNNTVNRLEIDGRVYVNKEFNTVLKEEYGNAIKEAITAGTSPFSRVPTQHIRHKLEPEKIFVKVAMIMKSLGFTRKKDSMNSDVYWEKSQ